MKRCTGCGQEKLTTEFYVNRALPDGLTYKCKDCQKEATRRWYEQNTERARSYSRTWRAEHLDEARAKGRAYNQARRDQQKVYMQQYRQANAEKLKAWRESYKQANADRIRAWRKDHWLRKGEQGRAKNRLWSKSNPEKNRARCHRRRAQKYQNGGRYTAQQWQALCAHFGNVCLCCGGLGPLQADHVQPLAHGGSNDISNIQPLCARCNQRKATQTIDYRDPELLAAFLTAEWALTQAAMLRAKLIEQTEPVVITANAAPARRGPMTDAEYAQVLAACDELA